MSRAMQAGAIASTQQTALTLAIQRPATSADTLGRGYRKTHTSIAPPIFMKLKVTFSLNHEINNYVNSLYKFRWLKHGRKNIQENLLKPFPESFKKDLSRCKSEKEVREVIKKFLGKDLNKREGKFKLIANNLEKAWKEKDDELVKKLEKVYGKKFPFKTLTVYLTSIPICPYNFKKRWIMVFAYTPKINTQLKIIVHELNHFMFLYYYGDLERKVGKKKFEQLKEALTVFTDPEDKKGYPAQKELRKWLKNQKGTISEIIEAGKWKKYI